jgi:NitT/TauT family transport system substrate-binding protein
VFKIRTIAAVLAVTAGLAGCAGGGTNTAEQEDGSYVLKYMQASDSFAYLPFFVAQNEGYFKDENVTIDRQPNVGVSAQAAQAVVTGQVDIGAIGTTGAYGAMAQGRAIQNLAVMTKQSLLEVVLSTATADELAARGVTPESPIEDRIAALKGLKIAAVPEGSISRVQFEAALSSYGLNPDTDVTLLPIEDSTALVASIREGTADAFVYTLPNTRIATAEGFGVTWISYPRGDVPALVDQYLIDITSTKAYAAKNADAIAAFLTAINRGVDLINEDPEAARAAARKSFPDMDEEVFDQAFDATLAAFADGIVPDADGFQRTFDLFNATLDSPTDLDFETAYDPSIADGATQ